MENQLEYLLDNYPPDHVITGGNNPASDPPLWTLPLWTKGQVLKAMEAAFNAGRRYEKKKKER
jgi:hypothetical protein